MTTEVRTYNKRTGKWGGKEFEDPDKAFDYYWEKSEEDDPDIEVELITKA